ncbi:hypothetical protein DJFAAGMI_01299 [Comamonas sp. PE63]|uniref:DUF4142 domain-containing protein n=1 Tax=Comamonas brasiliensis TaxID=1812482 RepID=A0ABS5LPZ5_9BURK|nr:DUF4142 domain-containing protein [Comamonas sp. PE63]MBS3018567.1 hypothetical protein [Comamonas sp. PE63]
MKVTNRLQCRGIRSTSLVLAAALLGLPLAANAQQPGNNAATEAAPKNETRKSKEQLSAQEVAFMKQAAQNNQAEIESSQLATKKASQAQVKAFATKMVEDHSKTGKELESLAAAKDVTLPKLPSAEQTDKLKLLEAAQGETFDRLYSESMGVRAHVETVDLFRKASQQVQDPQLKSFVTSTLPTLEHHLKMARDLQAAKSK